MGTLDRRMYRVGQPSAALTSSTQAPVALTTSLGRTDVLRPDIADGDRECAVAFMAPTDMVERCAARLGSQRFLDHFQNECFRITNAGIEIVDDRLVPLRQPAREFFTGKKSRVARQGAAFASEKLIQGESDLQPGCAEGAAFQSNPRKRRIEPEARAGRWKAALPLRGGA